jgi:hypothetical protein
MYSRENRPSAGFRLASMPDFAQAGVNRALKKADLTALEGFAPDEIRVKQASNRHTTVFPGVFPQFFPQVWKTLGTDQRLHGITAAGSFREGRRL